MADNANTPESVPYSRFQAVVAERNELRGQIEGYTTQVQTLSEQAAASDSLTAQIKELRAAHAAEAANWDTTRTLMEGGLMDPEGREVATFLHSRLPEEDRPPIGEWLSSFQGDGASPPKALAPYLSGTGVTPEPGARTEDTSSPATRVSSDAGVTSAASPTAPQWSSDRIRELRLEAQTTGDWSKYREARDAILEATAKRR